MMFENIMIPFLLGFNVILPDEEKANYDPEYSYELNKTTVALKEPVQTTQLTSTVTCHTFNVTDLRCLLHNIEYLSTVAYQNLNVINVASKEYIKSEHWFQIKFDSHGVQKVLVNQTTDMHMKSIIQDIVNQFNIGVKMRFRMSDMSFRNSFIMKENVPIGSCVTTYTLNSTQSMANETHDGTEHGEDVTDAGVIMYEQVTDHQRVTYVLIEKNRSDCDYSLEFVTFLNGIEVAEYKHVIEASNDNVRKYLKMVTTLHGQLPSDPWNPLGIPVFKEITQLNLTSIKSPKTKLFDTSYIWVDM